MRKGRGSTKGHQGYMDACDTGKTTGSRVEDNRGEDAVIFVGSVENG